MSYKARSLKIQSVLQKLLKSFKDSLGDADTKEEKAKTEHENLMKSKKSLRDKAENALTTMNGEGGARSLSKSEAEDEVSDLKDQVKNDEKFIQETKTSLGDKTKEWKARKELMTGEIAAVNKAIAILHSDDARDLFKNSFASHGASFLQVRRKSAIKHQLAHVADVINHAAAEAGDVRLVAIAATVSLTASGHFDKVITKIEKMIQQLEGESDEDKKVKKECEDNRKNDISEAKDTSHAIDDLSDKIDKLEEEISEHEDEIKENEEEIKKVKKELKEAIALRDEEHAEWKQNDADDKAAAELVGSAKKVLADFYKDNGLNFIQTKYSPPEVQAGEAPPPPPKTWEEPYGGAKESTGIISILGTIKDDIEKDRSDAEDEEGTAKQKFIDFKSESEKQIGSLESSNVDLEKAVSDKQDKIASAKEETGTKKKELGAAIKKLKDAQEGCDFITVNFELREENRKIEIEGLTKAKEILEKDN